VRRQQQKVTFPFPNLPGRQQPQHGHGGPSPSNRKSQRTTHYAHPITAHTLALTRWPHGRASWSAPVWVSIPALPCRVCLNTGVACAWRFAGWGCVCERRQQAGLRQFPTATRGTTTLAAGGRTRSAAAARRPPPIQGEACVSSSPLFDKAKPDVCAARQRATLSAASRAGGNPRVVFYMIHRLFQKPRRLACTLDGKPYAGWQVESLHPISLAHLRQALQRRGIPIKLRLRAPKVATSDVKPQRKFSGN